MLGKDKRQNRALIEIKETKNTNKFSPAITKQTLTIRIPMLPTLLTVLPTLPTFIVCTNFGIPLVLITGLQSIKFRCNKS